MTSLQHIIAVNESHLRRVLFDYVCCHQEDRKRLGLGNSGGQDLFRKRGRVTSHDRLGGLHHRYDRAASAQGAKGRAINLW